MNKSEINDIRDSKSFSKITFSRYSKKEAGIALQKSLISGEIESACYWGAEFICAGHFIELWEKIIHFMSTNIHLGSPKLPIYINMRFQAFKHILESGYVKQELRLRNNKKIRTLFAEIMAILSLSRKSHAYTTIKVNKEDFNITTLTNHLRAKSIKYAQIIFRNNDPKELFIPINELSYHLSKDSNDSQKACYWVEWILDFSKLCVKEKKKCCCDRRAEMPVSSNFQMDCVWMIWELLIYYGKKKDTLCNKIISALLNLFSIRFRNGTKRRRHFLIYFAISLINEPVNYKIPILVNPHINNKMIKNLTNKIDIIYTQIKKNEKAPNTNYLFNNELTSNSFLEQTIQKLDTLNTLTNKMPRTD